MLKSVENIMFLVLLVIWDGDWKFE